MKERIEIFPGRWIEVTKRVKQKAGVRMGARVRATLENGRVDEALVRLARNGRKYSGLLIDEAVAVAKEKGAKEAERITGVHHETIAQRRKKLKGCTGYDGRRYTLAQKKACVKMALELVASGGTHIVRVSFGKGDRTVSVWSKKKAFKEAGRRLGVNGLSIMFQWENGMIDLNAVARGRPSIPRRQPAFRAIGSKRLGRPPKNAPCTPKSPSSAHGTGL